MYIYFPTHEQNKHKTFFSHYHAVSYIEKCTELKKENKSGENCRGNVERKNK